MVKVGDNAPDFAVKDQNNRLVKLSDFRGKKVLLSFHPLAWTSVCAKQMKSLEENAQAFADANTVPLGISVDAVPTKRAWAKELGIEKTSLPSDFWPHGAIAIAYDIFRGNAGTSERANILVDENQQVVWVKLYPISELPDIAEVLQAIKGS